jgi:hypothetical protein
MSHILSVVHHCCSLLPPTTDIATTVTTARHIRGVSSLSLSLMHCCWRWHQGCYHCCLSPSPFPLPSLFWSSPFNLIVVCPPTTMALHLSSITPNIIPGLFGSIIVTSSSQATAAAAARPFHGGSAKNGHAGQHNNWMAQRHAHAIGDLTMIVVVDHCPTWPSLFLPHPPPMPAVVYTRQPLFVLPRRIAGVTHLPSPSLRLLSVLSLLSSHNGRPSKRDRLTTSRIRLGSSSILHPTRMHTDATFPRCNTTSCCHLPFDAIPSPHPPVVAVTIAVAFNFFGNDWDGIILPCVAW